MDNTNFQTPEKYAKLLASYLPNNCGDILEPTPGIGNLVKELKTKGNVIYIDDFFKLDKNSKFDYVVMNPPFSPMKLGYEILFDCMNMSNNIIALMPWLTIINSKKRTDKILNFGLKSITHLPRTAFPGSRVQTCILELLKNFNSDIIIRFAD